MNKIIKNKIVWEKWRDPFGYDDIEEALSYLSDNNISSKFTSEKPFLDENQDYILEDEEPDEPKIDIKTVNNKFVITPLGMMPLTENTAPSKIFNFWTGHTNFPISHKIMSIIENIPGVETLDVYTKYRLRVAVGKAFSDSNVLRDINAAVEYYLDHK